MIGRLSNLGFILYPGVSNKTSVMQETDKSCVIFKSNFCKNLELIMQQRLEANQSVSINRSLFGWLVFDVKDSDTKHTDYHSDFEVYYRK